MSQGHDHHGPDDGYQRPGQPYRCGRGAAWGKPCPLGPTFDGKCGGTQECHPTQSDGRLVCGRAKEAGGPCELGPRPDGSCSQCHPPCLPRLTLRGRRGRVTWQIAALTLLLLGAGFHFGARTKSRPLTADPGPLSALHASFSAGKEGCATCHPAHDRGLAGLLQATLAKQDFNRQCTACHAFGGEASHPHNGKFSSTRGPGATDCAMCHTEHRGVNGHLTTLTDTQCQACHRTQFERFDRGHPDFPDVYPKAARGNLKFNHTRHLQDYFTKPEIKARATSCTGCHVVAPRERSVRTLGFETACARCHADQISKTELTLLRLPEPVAPEKLPQLGLDEATPFMAWFLQRDGATNTYGVGLGRLLASVSRDGSMALVRALAPTNPIASSRDLLAGLSPDLLMRPAQAWLKQSTFEPVGAETISGWYWSTDLPPELHYQPAGHADPVVRAWLELALNAPAHATNAADAKRASAFRNELADASKGAGRCVKCHVINAPAARPAERELGWLYRPPTPLAHTKFSHGTHVGLRSCGDCHALDAKADYEGQFAEAMASRSVSSFAGVKRTTCLECHATGKVRSDCGLCHEYHLNPRLKETRYKADPAAKIVPMRR